MLIRVKNLLDTIASNTYLTQQEIIGVGTLHVQNANAAVSSWAIQAGRTGEEKAEVLLLSAAAQSGTQVVLSGTTAYAHPTDTPVYFIKWDKIIWKRSTSGTSGTASAFATSSITPDSPFTQYDDTSGAATYAYKTSFYNSALDVSSSDSDWITPSGYDFYTLSSIRQRVKDKMFSTGFIGDDSVIDNWINEYLELMTNAAIDVNQDYNLGSVNIGFSGTAELGTITASDFKQVRRVWMTTNGTDFYPSTKMESTTPRPNQIYNDTYPYFFMLGDTVMSRWPHDVSGTAAVLYYKLNPVLVFDGDTLPQPMRGYTKGFVDYALAQAKGKDGKADEKRDLENSAMATLDKFKKEATPRNKTGSGFIDIAENVTDEMSIYW